MRIALMLVLAVACKSESKRAEPQHDHHEDRNEPAAAPANLALDVSIDGTAAKWNADAFAKVPHTPGKATSGESRDVWSLRELAHTLVGPTARVVSVSNATATKAIDAAAWADASRIPIVHTTRRGSLKFRWSDAAGTWGESELNDVTKLELVR